MTIEVRLEQSPATSIAVIRDRVAQRDISRVVPALCGEVWEFARSRKMPKPGRHVAVYLNGNIDLEAGAEVTEPFAGNERVVQSKLPAGPVATATLVGSYAGLGATHAAIVEWCKASGQELAGPSWEIYGHWVEDQSQMRTDVYYLIASKS